MPETKAKDQEHKAEAISKKLKQTRSSLQEFVNLWENSGIQAFSKIKGLS